MLGPEIKLVLNIRSIACFSFTPHPFVLGMKYPLIWIIRVRDSCNIILGLFAPNTGSIYMLHPVAAYRIFIIRYVLGSYFTPYAGYGIDSFPAIFIRVPYQFSLSNSRFAPNSYTV